MKVTSGKGQRFGLEGLSELEMGLLWIAVVEGNQRIFAGQNPEYPLKDLKKARKLLEKVERALQDWVHALPKDAPLRENLFKAPGK